jgi:poly-gamma-glutamate synthesis protein (capsule biosynthesis protein)
MLRLLLTGDVMTGRGVDQVLPHPSDPKLYETLVKDARDYVELAEAAHGPITQPVSFKYIWGDVLAELESAQGAHRIINLETSITTSNKPWPGKPIQYKMHPQNIGCLTAGHVHVCTLANNHVLDWDYDGLCETLETLDHAGILHAGAGRNLAEAQAPAALAFGSHRLLLFGLGSTTSGIPPDWAATNSKPGVHLLDDLSAQNARRIAGQMQNFQKRGDLIMVSIHWGANWGFDLPHEQIEFAHALIDSGVALIHGHSSHHIKSLETYKNHLILYGCGDLLTDYEGIQGYEPFRGDLAFFYLPELAPETGHLLSLRLVPVQTRQFQLHRTSSQDTQYLHSLMNDLCAGLAPRFQLTPDCSLEFHSPVI